MNPFNKDTSSHINKLSKDGRNSLKEFFAFKGRTKRRKKQEFNVYHAILKDLQIGNGNNSTTQIKSILIEDSTPVTDEDSHQMTVLDHYSDLEERIEKDSRKKNNRKLYGKGITIATIGSCLAMQTADISSQGDFSNPSDTSCVKIQLHENKNNAMHIDDCCACSMHRAGPQYPDNSARKLKNTKHTRKQNNVKKSSSSCQKSSSLKCINMFEKNHDYGNSERFRKQTTDQKQQKNIDSKKSINQNEIKKEKYDKQLEAKFNRHKNKEMSCKARNTWKSSVTSMNPEYIMPKSYKVIRNKSQNSRNTTDPNYIRLEENKLKGLKTSTNDNSATTKQDKKVIKDPESNDMNDKSSIIGYCIPTIEETISTTSLPHTALENKNKQMYNNFNNTSSSDESSTESDVSTTSIPYINNINGLDKENKQMYDNSSNIDYRGGVVPTEENVSINDEQSISSSQSDSDSSCCSCETHVNINHANNEKSSFIPVEKIDPNNETNQEAQETLEENIMKTEQLVEEETLSIESCSDKKYEKEFSDSSVVKKLPNEMKQQSEIEDCYIPKEQICEITDNYGDNLIKKEDIAKNIPKLKQNLKKKKSGFELKVLQKCKKESSLTAQDNSHYVIRPVSSVCSCKNHTEQKVPKHCLIEKGKQKFAYNPTPREKCKQICDKKRLNIKLKVPALNECCPEINENKLKSEQIDEKHENNKKPHKDPGVVKNVLKSTNRHAKQDKDENSVRDNARVEKTCFCMNEDIISVYDNDNDDEEEEIECPVRCIKKEYTICGKKKSKEKIYAEQNSSPLFSSENKQQYCPKCWYAPPPQWMSFGQYQTRKSRAPRNYNVNIDLTYLKSTLKLIIIALALSPCIGLCMCCQPCISK